MSNPLRILQVVTHMNRGGLETMIMNYYRNINRDKIQFDFLTHREYDGDYGEEIKALGGIIYHLPTLNPFSLNYNKALNLFFKEHPEYQIVHVHQDCMSGVILKAAAQHGIKVRIAHSHSTNQVKNAKYLIKLLYKRSIPKYATRLFACETSAGKWMFNRAPFTVMNNAIDCKKYAFNIQTREKLRKSFNISSDSLVIGHVGRFNSQKNHKFLIDIFAKVKKYHKDAVLLLVGDDSSDLGNEIHQKIRRLGLQNVIFTGVRSDVCDIMQAMDVFVFPSLCEGLPVALIEAQAASLPCLVSDSVPAECKKTNLVQMISLKESAETWASHIIEALNIERQDMYNDIKAVGLDIVENANQLEEIYINSINTNNI